MANPVTVTKAGNQMRIIMDDATEFLAVPTGYGYWVVTSVGNDVPPEPEPGSGFKWPFPRANHTTYPGHSGMDWGGRGRDIHAIGPGVVQRVYVYAGNTYGWGTPGAAEPIWRGNCVVIDHGVIGGERIWSLYAHMAAAPAFTEGQAITAGQVIGTTGNTGYSDGSHLHFEVIYNGVRLRQGQGGYERTLSWMDAHAVGVW